MKAEALRKENQTLKAQVETLTGEIDKLKVTIQQMEPPSSRESIEASLNAEAQSSLQFLNKEYDDFGEFRQHAQREIQRLNSSLLEIKSKVDTIGKAIEDLQDYSDQRGTLGFSVLRFWLFFRSVFRFLCKKTSVFRFWFSLRFAEFSFFSIWFSVFVENLSGFSVLLSDVLFRFSYFVLYIWVPVSLRFERQLISTRVLFIYLFI